jgi:hypothetical protein
MSSHDLATVPENIGPEKEPIIFNINIDGGESPDYEQLIKQIKLVAEQHLYRWKTFPFSKIVG